MGGRVQFLALTTEAEELISKLIMEDVGGTNSSVALKIKLIKD